MTATLEVLRVCTDGTQRLLETLRSRPTRGSRDGIPKKSSPTPLPKNQEHHSGQPDGPWMARHAATLGIGRTGRATIATRLDRRRVVSMTTGGLDD